MNKYILVLLVYAIFFVVIQEGRVCFAQPKKNSVVDNDIIVQKINQYYNRFQTVRIYCFEKTTDFGGDNKAIYVDDELMMNMNFTTKSLNKRILNTNVPTNKPEETLITQTYSLDIRRNAKDKISLFGTSKDHNKQEFLPMAFYRCLQSLPFGYLSVGTKTYTVLEWLENNPINVLNQSDNELTVESVGDAGSLKMKLSVIKNDYFIKELLCLLNENERKGGFPYETKYYVVEQDIVSGVTVPVKFSVVVCIAGGEELVYDSEKNTVIPRKANPYCLESVIEFTKIEINPFSKDVDLTFGTSVPNGTEVNLSNPAHIQYIWLDGKIVPKTDEAMLAIARGGHKFMPGPQESRFWMMSIGIFLILLSCGKLAYDHFKKKNSGDT